MVDAIISFPWLEANHIGVIPHLKALATFEPEFSTLLSVTRKRKAYWDTPRGGIRRTTPPLMRGDWSHFNRPVQRTRPRRRRRGQPVSIETPDENEEELLLQVDKLKLHIPPCEKSATLDFLSDKEKGIVAQNVRKHAQIRVVNMVDTNESASLPPGWDASKLEQLRAKIHADFDGTALREEVIPNPPVRGLYGYAHIPLVPQAVPTRTKPFQMHGE